MSRSEKDSKRDKLHAGYFFWSVTVGSILVEGDPLYTKRSFPYLLGNNFRICIEYLYNSSVFNNAQIGPIK